MPSFSLPPVSFGGRLKDRRFMPRKPLMLKNSVVRWSMAGGGGSLPPPAIDNHALLPVSGWACRIGDLLLVAFGRMGGLSASPSGSRM